MFVSQHKQADLFLHLSILIRNAERSVGVNLPHQQQRNTAKLLVFSLKLWPAGVYALIHGTILKLIARKFGKLQKLHLLGLKPLRTSCCWEAVTSLHEVTRSRYSLVQTTTSTSKQRMMDRLMVMILRIYRRLAWWMTRERLQILQVGQKTDTNLHFDEINMVESWLNSRV